MSNDRLDRMPRTEPELVEFNHGAHVGARSVLQSKKFWHLCEDIAQDATIEYIESNLQAKNPFSLGYRIGRYRAIDEIRYSSTRPNARGGDDASFAEPAIEYGDSLIENSRITFYLKEILALPTQQAFVLINEWLIGFKTRAATLQYMKGRRISDVYARQCLSSARKELRARLLETGSV